MERVGYSAQSAVTPCDGSVALSIWHRVLRAAVHGHTVGLVAILFCLSGIAHAQELQPRAFLPAPAGFGFFGVSYSNNSGGLLFDPSLPVEDSHVNAHVTSASLGYTLGLLGRTSQVLAVLPYVVADVNGRLLGVDVYRYRSGMADSLFRFAVNLHGGPAMTPKEYAAYRKRTIVGASLTALAPTGQYDPNVVINIGSNRWAFKPEVGISRPYKKWFFEGAAGAWLFTRNTKFYGGTVRTQNPLGSFQAHVVRLLPHRTWFAFDSTFYTGGRTNVNGERNADYQGNTRFGLTYGIALARRQALRFAYFQGATTRVGTDIRSLSVAYQIGWLSHH